MNEILANNVLEKVINLSEEQQEAFDLCTSSKSKIFIINGRPGTGKTTMAFYLVQQFLKQKESVALCAPTGRAAKKLSEKTGYPAQTIHRLLKWQHPGGFEHGQDFRLPYSLIVVDETSMVDLFLFHSLLEALSDDARLVLVGDPHQLPPVGPGAPFRDLIQSGKVPQYELRKIHRQAAGNKIITAAHAILDGNISGIEWDGERKDLQLISMGDCEQDAIIDYIEEELLNVKFIYDISRDDCQVLAPMRKATIGITSMNTRFQGVFNPPSSLKKEYRGANEVFREGDRVIQNKNDYDLGIFNGDIGTIARIYQGDKTEKRIMSIDFDDTGNIGLTTTEHINRLSLAYSLTIHKSQGSEYELVIIPCHRAHIWMWSRPLIYTALTRAKSFCILVGDMTVVNKAIRNNKDDGRMTWLKERVQAG